jgi:glycosyltransferase involved in cell wall biosynthesis
VARVLMIAYTSYASDGRVQRHAQALAQRGDHVDVICLENSQPRDPCGVNVIGLRQRRYRGSSRSNYVRSYLRFFAAAALTALRLSLRRRYHLAIVCTMPDAAVLCAIPSRLLGAKVVLDMHDTMPELYRDKFGGQRGAIGARLLTLEERASTWFAHRVLAVHDLHRARLESAGVRAGKIRVVLNVPDPRIFTPARGNAAANGAGPQFTIVCHGTVAHRLGLDVALHALAMLGARCPDVRLLVIGSGDYLAEAKAMVIRLGLEPRVRFLPPVPLEHLPQVLCHADLGLVPNRASSATHLMLPVKMLEYAALGIPVVAARLRTIEHYFGADSVRFFEPGSAAALARAIEELRANRQRRLELACNARRVLEQISWDVQRVRYFDALDSLLNRGRGEPGDAVRLDAS